MNKSEIINEITIDPLSFLAGNGEMSALTRSYNWSQTAVGPFTAWPQSLTTTISIILHSKFPMFLWWGEDLVQFYNDAYRPSLGNDGKHPAALGQKGEDCWPETWATIKPLIDQVFAGGEATWSEDQLIPIYRNGKIEDVYWTFSFSPVYNESGKVGGVLVVCHETTEKVINLNKFKISDQRFQNLVREASVGIIVLSGEEMQVSIVNEAFGRLINRTPLQLLNQPLFRIVPETEEFYRSILENVRQTGESLHLFGSPYFINNQGERKEGFLDLVYQPYKEADSTITGVMVLCYDVTERKLAEEAIKLKNAELVRINNDLDTFIYTASHDLKTPILNIEGLLAVLSEEFSAKSLQEEEFGRAMGMMQDAVNRFKKTIINLTDVVKLQQQNGQEATSVNLSQIIEEILFDLDQMITAAQARIEVNVTDCPVIHFSERNLRRIVYNVISNAIKYRSADRLPHICIQSYCRPGYNVIAVTDNGLGVETKNVNDLFAMFKRFHDHVEGTGIGLYMVKKILENAGGTIKVQSKVGEGSTFKMYFKSNSST